MEAGTFGIELVAEARELVLGEVVGLEAEDGGDQLEAATARLLAPGGQGAQICVGDQLNTVIPPRPVSGQSEQETGA